MIEVTAAIIKNDGKVLIARRKKDKYLEGFWEFPGGKLENNETAEECLKRELNEEFSIITEIDGYVGESIYDYKDFKIKLIAFDVNWIGGEFELTDHDSLKWVDPKELKSYNLAPADIPLVDQYISYIK